MGLSILFFGPIIPIFHSSTIPFLDSLRSPRPLRLSFSIRFAGRSFSGFLFRSLLGKIQYDLSSDPGRDPANLRTSRPAVAAFVVKGLPLFRVNQAVHLSVADLVDLRANRVADSIPEKVADLPGFFHGPSVLRPVFELFPPHQAAHRHDRPGERPAGFPHPGHSAGQCTAGLKDLLASHTELFLQSRKNGLGSAHIGHVVLQSQLRDLIQKFLPILHDLLLLIC